MKAIMVMFDTLNRHMLPPYGCDWTHAPNFQRLAERTVTFDKCCVGSMPCMPARRELHTGRHNFLHRSWGPLEPFDDSMPEILRSHGVYAHLATDHQHYFEDGGGIFGMHGGHLNVTDGRYVYMRAPVHADNRPLYEYTLMPTHIRSRFGVEELQDIELAGPFSFTKGCRVMRIPGRPWASHHEFGTLLWDVESDPCQQQPLQDPAIEARMIRLMVQLLQQNDAPLEQYARLGLEVYVHA